MKRSGSASGRCRSNMRTFFSCPPVRRCDTLWDIATLRTMWLWGNECSASPLYVSHTFLWETEGASARMVARSEHGAEGDVRGEVCAAGSGAGGVWGEFAGPDGALVTEKGAYPVAGPLAQHGVAVLAAGDEDVCAVIL